MTRSASPPFAFRTGHAGAGMLAVWFALLVFGFAQAGAAHATDALAQWRQRAAQIRILAENDAPRAYTEAHRLQEVFPADALPADRARLWNLLSRIEIYLALTAPATRHAELALDVARQHADRVGQAEAHLNICLNSINEGRIDAMTMAATSSVELLEGVDQPDLLGEALLRMTMMYHRLGQLDESVRMSMQALEIAGRTNNPLALVYAHQGLGISLLHTEHFKEAHEHFLQMRDQARAAQSRMLEAYAVLNLGNTAAKLGDRHTGELLIREGIKLSRAIGAPFAVNHALYGLADLFRDQGRPAESLPLLSETVATYQRYPNKIGLWYSLMARSAIYLSLGNRPAALSDTEHAYALARDVGLSLYLSETAQLLATIHAARGDHRRAYELAVEAAAMTSKAAREKMNARVVELAQRYETESKRRQIEELTRRNEQQTAELKQRMLQQRWLWTVLGGSIAMLAGTFFFLVRLRRSHHIIRSLNASLEQRVQSRTAELRQQTRYLRTLIDALPWWVWLKDTESRYLAVNQAAADTCDLHADELVGKSDLDVRPRELAEAFRADDQDVMTTRRGKTVEEQQLVSGGTIWLETFKAPVLDEDGTVLGTVGFARDISERKAAEAAREAALAEAQRLARVRSEFLAQMSHELRTPLNGILGYTQIMRRDKTLNDQQRAKLTVIQQSGEHLLTLINDTLDLAKIEAGKLELYPVDIPITRFLNTIAEMVRVKAEQKNIAFICEAAPDLPAVIHADEGRLRQTLLNLLANALKFTERGQVQLQVRNAAPSRLRFEVRDTGVGIPADRLEAIFHPFEQAGEALHRIGGTGLGLSISRQYVRLMGGEIQVASRVGEGSTFWFELELSAAAADSAAGDEVPAAERLIAGYEGERKTVLVVDDIAENRAVAIDMLTQIGFVMAEAANGRDALDQAQAIRPDLILMDIVMPEMDGIESTRRLRQLPSLKEVPIIAISASASAEQEERYLAAGMNAFLPKPIEFSRLLDQMAALLKLAWTYEPAQAALPLGPAAPEAIIAPPPEEMTILYALARRGDMRDILQRAAYLTELDERYRPFAIRLREFASRYQSKAITNFVEQYMDKEQTP